MSTITSAGPFLGTAFGLGILFQSIIGTLAFYTKDYGYGPKLRKDRRRLVLVLGLAFAAVWSQLVFGAFMVPTTIPLACLGLSIAATIADQAARTIIGAYLLWSVAHVNKSRAEKPLLGVLIGLRAAAGIFFVGFTRFQFVQVCLPRTTLLPAAIVVIGYDVIIIIITVVRILILGLMREARNTSSSITQAHSKGLLFVTGGFIIWLATSVLMLLGLPGSSVIFMTALPSFGLTLLIGFLATHHKSLVVARGQEPSVASALSPGPQAPLNDNNDDDDPLITRSQRNSVKAGNAKGVHAYTTTTELLEEKQYRGPGGGHFADVPRSTLVVTTKLNITDGRKKKQSASSAGATIRSLGISGPMITNTDQFAPSVPTMSLTDALLQDKERREGVRVRMKRPPPPPVYTPAIIPGGDLAITRPTDIIPLPIGGTLNRATSTSLSVMKKDADVKRRSPTVEYESGIAETTLERKNTLPRTPKAGPPTSLRFNRPRTPPMPENDGVQQVMLINSIVYNNPETVAAISKSAKTYTDSRQKDTFGQPTLQPLIQAPAVKVISMIHRPRPYSRRPPGDRGVFDGEKSPGRRPRSRSASSLYSRSSIYTDAGTEEPLPPLPGAGRNSAHKLPNHTRSMTMSEKTRYLASPLSPARSPTKQMRDHKRRSSVPEIPIIDAKFSLASQNKIETIKSPLTVVATSNITHVVRNHSTEVDTWWKSPENIIATNDGLPLSTLEGSIRAPQAMAHTSSSHLSRRQSDRKNPFIASSGSSEFSKTPASNEVSSSNIRLETSTQSVQDDSELSPHHKTMDAEFFVSGQSSVKSLVPQNNWHKRIGDSIPTFSERRTHARNKSKTMPPPIPLLLTSIGRPTIILTPDAATEYVDTPNRALQEIQNQLKKFEQQNRESIQTTMLRTHESGRDSRAELLEELEKELGSQTTFLSTLQHNFARDSNLTMSPDPDLDSPGANMRVRMGSDLSLDISPIMTQSKDARQSIYDAGSSSFNNTLTRATVWQQKLAKAQAEFEEKSPEMYRRKPSINFLEVGRTPMPSPTPPESVHSISPSESGYSGTDDDEELDEEEEENNFSLETAESYGKVELFSPSNVPRMLWKQPAPIKNPTLGALWVTQLPQLEVPSLYCGTVNVRTIRRFHGTQMKIQSRQLWQKTKPTRAPAGATRDPWCPSEVKIGLPPITQYPRQSTGIFRRANERLNINTVASTDRESGIFGRFPSYLNGEATDRKARNIVVPSMPLQDVDEIGDSMHSLTPQEALPAVDVLVLNSDLWDDYDVGEMDDSSDIDDEIEEDSGRASSTTLADIATLLGSNERELPSLDSLFSSARATMIESYAQGLDYVEDLSRQSLLAILPDTRYDEGALPRSPLSPAIGYDIPMGPDLSSEVNQTFEILDDLPIISATRDSHSEVCTHLLWTKQEKSSEKHCFGLRMPPDSSWHGYAADIIPLKTYRAALSSSLSIQSRQLWSKQFAVINKFDISLQRPLWVPASSADIQDLGSETKPCSSVTGAMMNISPVSNEVSAVYITSSKLWEKKIDMPRQAPVTWLSDTDIPEIHKSLSGRAIQKSRQQVSYPLQISSSRLWEKTQVRTKSISTGPMWIPSKAFDTVANSMSTRNLKTLWTRRDVLFPETISGLFNSSTTTRVSPRQTHGIPAAINMFRKPRATWISSEYLASNNLWFSSSSEAHIPRNWLLESTLTTSSLYLPTMPLITAPPNAADGSAHKSISDTGPAIIPPRITVEPESGNLRSKDIEAKVFTDSSLQNSMISKQPYHPVDITPSLESPKTTDIPTKRGFLANKSMFEQAKSGQAPSLARKNNGSKSMPNKTISRFEANMQKRQLNTPENWERALAEAMQKGGDTVSASAPTVPGKGLITRKLKSLIQTDEAQSIDAINLSAKLTGAHSSEENRSDITASTKGSLTRLVIAKPTTTEANTTIQATKLVSPVNDLEPDTTVSEGESGTSRAIIATKLKMQRLLASRTGWDPKVVAAARIEIPLSTEADWNSALLAAMPLQSFAVAIHDTTNSKKMRNASTALPNSQKGTIYKSQLLNLDNMTKDGSDTDAQGLVSSSTSPSVTIPQAANDPAIRHPVFFGTVMTSAAITVHPAAVGHTSFASSIRHPIFACSSMLTAAIEVHSVCIGYVQRPHENHINSGKQATMPVVLDQEVFLWAAPASPPSMNNNAVTLWRKASQNHSRSEMQELETRSDWTPPRRLRLPLASLTSIYLFTKDDRDMIAENDWLHQTSTPKHRKSMPATPQQVTANHKRISIAIPLEVPAIPAVPDDQLPSTPVVPTTPMTPNTKKKSLWARLAAAANSEIEAKATQFAEQEASRMAELEKKEVERRVFEQGSQLIAASMSSARPQPTISEVERSVDTKMTEGLEEVPNVVRKRSTSSSNMWEAHESRTTKTTSSSAMWTAYSRKKVLPQTELTPPFTVSPRILVKRINDSTLTTLTSMTLWNDTTKSCIIAPKTDWLTSSGLEPSSATSLAVPAATTIPAVSTPQDSYCVAENLWMARTLYSAEDQATRLWTPKSSASHVFSSRAIWQGKATAQSDRPRFKKRMSHMSLQDLNSSSLWAGNRSIPVVELHDWLSITSSPLSIDLFEAEFHLSENTPVNDSENNILRGATSSVEDNSSISTDESQDTELTTDTSEIDMNFILVEDVDDVGKGLN